MTQAQRAFVVMPFGVKPATDGAEIDFDKVYEALIVPAIRDAGLVPHRADAEKRAGGIHNDMFQELLLADLVVAELSIDNSNVFYELGVRHALRDAGIVLLYDRSRRPPFDVGGERMLPYRRLTDPIDEAALAQDRAALTGMIQATMTAWRGRKVSPVFRSLPNLEEPEWRRLKVGDVNEFWDALETWQRRIATAQRKQRPADILLLADETPNRVLEVEALCKAAKALLQLNSPFYALATVERALEVDPDNLWLRQTKGQALGRCRRFEEARVWLEALAEDHQDGETLGILGRTFKDHWTRLWRREDVPANERIEHARDSAATLADAIHAYARAFRNDPKDYFPGINVVTLTLLHQHLTDESAEVDTALVVGGVRWAATAALERQNGNGDRGYWEQATLAELELLTGNGDKFLELFRTAVAKAVATTDLFALDSTSQQLTLLAELDFKPERVARAAEVLARGQGQLRRLTGEREPEPERVVIFSGHMVDAPHRAVARFPAAAVPAAKARIEQALDQLGLKRGDLGVCGGASGGDLLFAEACLAREARVELRLAKPEAEFLRESVTFADVDNFWYELFQRVTASQRSRTMVMADEVGPTPKGVSAHDRCNRWMLHAALSRGIRRVRGLALWDGKSGDGPGGTQHMVRLVHELTGAKPIIIDPATL